MKSLLSATAALALMVAAGQASAQTAATQPNDSAAMIASPDAATQTGAPATSGTADQSAAASTDTAKVSAAHSSHEAAANRREAKITDKLNEQQLANNSSGESSNMSGSSSAMPSNEHKMHGDWKAGQKQESTEPGDTAGSGSSLGASPAPNAGSDTIGKSEMPATTPNSGDKAASPDSAAPESASPTATPDGGDPNAKGQ